MPTKVLAFSWADIFVLAIPAHAFESEPTPIPVSTPTPKEYLRENGNEIDYLCGYTTKEPCRSVNLADQLEAVIRAEFGPDWETATDYDRCNREYGCGSGQGLIMLIVSTRDYCSKKLGREIKREDPYDSIDCGLWLLRNNGVRDWEKWSGPY